MIVTSIETIINWLANDKAVETAINTEYGYYICYGCEDARPKVLGKNNTRVTQLKRDIGLTQRLFEGINEKQFKQKFWKEGS